MLGEVHDRLLEFRGALDGALTEEPEPALDLIQPRGIGRREVQVQARPLGNPGAHHRVLVRGVVVAHKVNAKVLGSFPVNQRQEAEPLLTAVPLLAALDHLARGHVDGGEQRRRAVADIVVRVAFGIAEA